MVYGFRMPSSYKRGRPVKNGTGNTQGAKEFRSFLKAIGMDKSKFIKAYKDKYAENGTLMEDLELSQEALERYEEQISTFADLYNDSKQLFNDGFQIFDLFDQYVKNREMLRKARNDIVKDGGNPMMDKDYVRASKHLQKTLKDVESMKMKRFKLRKEMEAKKEKLEGRKAKDEDFVDVSFKVEE